MYWMIDLMTMIGVVIFLVVIDTVQAVAFGMRAPHLVRMTATWC